jgi:serine/threonine protein kinase
MNSPFFQRYDLDLKETILGDGSFSVCRRCVDRLSGKEFSTRFDTIFTAYSTPLDRSTQRQGHPNVVQLIDVLQDDAHTYIVMEHLKAESFSRGYGKRNDFARLKPPSL